MNRTIILKILLVISISISAQAALTPTDDTFIDELYQL